MRERQAGKTASMSEIPRRKLGKTGVEVTAIGLGGEGVLRTFGRAREAVSLIRRAIELGITYCDCAKAYAGSEDYYGEAFEEPGLRDKVFLTSKSAERRATAATRDLESTLKRMRVSHLDLWQVHDVRTTADLEAIFGPGGAIEAFTAAKKAGKCRFIGVTGHHDPTILTKAIELFPFETVLLPVNAAEPHHRSFLDETLPLAVSKGLGVIGMKVLRGFVGWGAPPRIDLPPELQRQKLTVSGLIRFALSQPISTAIIGCETIGQLEENVAVARIAKPMAESERDALLERTRPHARDALAYKGV
jgi:aryl-alcohol dehydrogenase-like predicted oxidoreductase